MDKEKLEEISDEYELTPAVPQEIPESTFWPIFLAFGIVLFFWGFLTSLIISAAGFFLIIISLSGWIGEIQK